MFLNLLFEQPAVWATWVGVVGVSIVLHELGHAFAATWQGDPTPKIRGHLTWNPVVHMGWLSLGLLAAFGIAFGSTPVTPSRFRNRRWGETLVSLAGPAVNLLLAIAASAVYVGFVAAGGKDAPGASLAQTVVVLNCVLLLLNLIPLPPLDGFGALEGAFDLGGAGAFLRSLQPLPLVLAIVLVNTDAFMGFVGALAAAIVGGFALLAALAFGG